MGAIARRKGTHVPVLVTNVHVIADHPTDLTLQGNEFVYQGGTDTEDWVAQLYTETDDEGNITYRSWVPQMERDAGPGSGSNVNVADIASAVLLADVPYTFHVHFPNHNHGDNDDDHIKRPIVGPAVEPREGMSVIAVGSTTEYRTPRINVLERGGDLTVPYRDPDTSDIAARYVYEKENIIILNQTGQDDGSDGGDSGSAYLWLDEFGNYRPVAIHFLGKAARPRGVSINGFAVSAKKVEELLDIYFGVEAPSAVAEYRVNNASNVVRPGDLVTLDGSGSSAREPEASLSTYGWEQDFGSASAAIASRDGVTLSSASAVSPTFTAPAHATTLKFKLTVTDSNGAKASDTVTVTVNTTPTANAGDDKTAYRGQTVELNGSGSDPDGDDLTYSWEQLGLDELGVTAVTPVTINNADQATANFVAPNQIEALSFKLTVTDNLEASHSDTVQVTVQNRSPIALAGPDKVIPATNEVTLEGSVSDLDPDDRSSVTHTWTQHGNNPSTVILSEVEGRPAQRTFTPTVEGIYTFILTATDQHRLSASDDVRVRVLPAADNVIPANVTATAAAGRGGHQLG